MIQESRERPLHELLSRDMVDIYVGPKNTHWILHEKLLCYRSKFFREIFHNTSKRKNTKNIVINNHSSNGTASPSKNHAYGLPDEDDAAFKLFVGWLYSERVPIPSSEPDLTPLLDLYLMAEKWEISALFADAIDAIRTFYQRSNSWPSLRRVQYIYANTRTNDPLRRLLVACVAHMLVAGQDSAREANGKHDDSASIPRHWENALRRNGQLAVDVILAVKTHLQPQSVADVREESAKPLVEEMNGLRVTNGHQEEEDEDEKLDWGDALTPPGYSERSTQSERGQSEKDDQ